MAKNQYVKDMAKAYDKGYTKGVEDGGTYWTMVMVLAIYNLYGWTKAFDRIEAEMSRIDAEMRDGNLSDNSAKLALKINEIRGGNYFRIVEKERI